VSEEALYEPYERKTGMLVAHVNPDHLNWVADQLAAEIPGHGGFAISHRVPQMVLIPANSESRQKFLDIMEEIRSGRRSPNP
jgi:hypothetical protein